SIDATQRHIRAMHEERVALLDTQLLKLIDQYFECQHSSSSRRASPTAKHRAFCKRLAVRLKKFTKILFPICPLLGSRPGSMTDSTEVFPILHSMADFLG